MDRPPTLLARKNMRKWLAVLIVVLSVISLAFSQYLGKNIHKNQGYNTT